MIVHTRRSKSGRLVSVEVWDCWCVVVMDENDTDVDSVDDCDSGRDAMKVYQGVR